MTPKPSYVEAINIEEELVQLKDAVENLELFDHETDPLNVQTYLADIERAARRAWIGIEGRLS